MSLWAKVKYFLENWQRIRRIVFVPLCFIVNIHHKLFSEDMRPLWSEVKTLQHCGAEVKTTKD